MVSPVVNKAFMNWSGGKDSALALYKALQDETLNIAYLLTSINASSNRISMHGVRRELLEKQAEAIGIPLQTIELPEQPNMVEYDELLMNKVAELKSLGCTHAVFGDIFLEDLKEYREKKLGEAGIECIFPLWKIDTRTIMHELITLGFKSIIVSVNDKFLDKSFCGRMIDESFVNDLPPNVDVCGENGEFHSFVFDGPIFNHPVSFKKGEIVTRYYEAPKIGVDVSSVTVERYGFNFCDLIPV